MLSARIGHPTVSRDLPALNCIEVITGVSPARCDQAGARWLHPAFVIERPALDLQWLSIPDEWQSKAREAFFEDGLLKHAALPSRPAIDRDIDPSDVAATGPG